MDNYNGFSSGYQPVYQPNMYYQPTVTQPMYQTQRNWPQQSTAAPSSYQPTTTGNIIWIQGGLDGAKAYANVQPGVPVALWDSDEKTIYIKSLDQTGKPQITIIDYVERGDEQKDNVKPIEYVTREQLEDINNHYSSLSDQINKLGGQIENIENRISNINKMQNNNQNNRRGNK